MWKELLDNTEAVLFDLDGTVVDSMWIWKDIDIDDGLLEVALVRPPKNIMEASEGFTSLVSGTPSDLILRFKTDRLLIESEQKIKWTIDGEESGSFGVNEIECLHKAVNIMLNDK